MSAEEPQISTPDNSEIGEDRLRRCLAMTMAERVRGDADLNPDLLSLAAHTELRPAAVLVPLIRRVEGWQVLLTRRTETLSQHAGQISFPGGRLDPCDADPQACALRETEEEIGLHRRHIEVVGWLDRYITGTGFHVTPVVGFIQPPFELTIDPREVAEVFEVPLRHFLDPRNHQRHSALRQGVERFWHAMPYGNYYIWGATAGMLMNLYQRLVEE